MIHLGKRPFPSLRRAEFFSASSSTLSLPTLVGPRPLPRLLLGSADADVTANSNSKVAASNSQMASAPRPAKDMLGGDVARGSAEKRLRRPEKTREPKKGLKEGESSTRAKKGWFDIGKQSCQMKRLKKITYYYSRVVRAQRAVKKRS